MPLTSISVKNHKAIKEGGLTLNNLKAVNYLVGANGSGKSSFLEAIFWNSLTKNQKELLRLSVTNDHTYPFESYPPKVSITNSLNQEINYVKKVLLVFNSQNSEFYRHDLKLGMYKKAIEKDLELDSEYDLNHDMKIKNKSKISSSAFEKTHDYFFNLLSDTKLGNQENLWITKLQIINPSNWTFLTSIFHLGFQSIEYKNIGYREFDREFYQKLFAKIFVDNKNAFKKLSLQLTLEDTNEKRLEFRHNFIQSSGQYILLQLMQLDALLNKFKSDKIYNEPKEIIILEEPESYLHPKFQKYIPLILDQIAKRHNVQFFVSTHSPFVINASGEFKDTQRVYLIEDGQCHNSDGYSGYNARTKAKEMLGYEENEFMPSKIIFCEETLVEFLTIINNRFYQKDIVFKRPKTDGDDATVLGVHKATELIKKAFENVLYSDFLIILDTPSSNNEITLARNLQKNYPNSVIILNTSSFEKKFGQNPKEIENQQGGKKQNARNKANEIQNKQEFEMLFPELFGEGLSLF